MSTPNIPRSNIPRSRMTVWRYLRTAVFTDVDSVACVLAGATILGSILGVLDASGDAKHQSDWGSIPIVGPCVFASYVALSLCWRTTPESFPASIVRCGVVLPLLLCIPTSLAAALTGSLPAVQATVQTTMDANGGFHYWADEAFGWPALPLYYFAGVGLSGFFALLVLLVITLPYRTVFGRPATELGFAAPRSGRRREERITAIATTLCLSSATIGAGLLVMTKDTARLDFGIRLERAAMAFQDPYELPALGSVLGVLFLAIAVLLLIVAAWARWRRVPGEADKEPAHCRHRGRPERGAFSRILTDEEYAEDEGL